MPGRWQHVTILLQSLTLHLSLNGQQSLAPRYHCHCVNRELNIKLSVTCLLYLEVWRLSLDPVEVIIIDRAFLFFVKISKTSWNSIHQHGICYSR